MNLVAWFILSISFLALAQFFEFQQDFSFWIFSIILEFIGYVCFLVALLIVLNLWDRIYEAIEPKQPRSKKGLLG